MRRRGRNRLAIDLAPQRNPPTLKQVIRHAKIATTQAALYRYTMSTAYFLKNLAIAAGLLILGLSVWFYKDPVTQDIHYGYLSAALLSTLLFPLSKKLIESFFLTFTTRSFWTTGLFTESPGKNGLYVMYYIVCMLLAIPVAGAYLMYVAIKKVARQGHS